MKFQKKYLPFLFLLALMLIAGCVSGPQVKPEISLENRVRTLMQAKIDSKWDVVYAFHEASFRKTISQEAFSQKPRKLQFKAFSIEGLEILPSGKEAQVKVKTDIIFQGYNFKNAPENQYWVKEGKQWYIKKKSKVNPFCQKKPEK